MQHWKIELSWHDAYAKQDRRFRDVVEAASFDAACLHVKTKAAAMGLVDFGVTVVCQQGAAFSDLECKHYASAALQFTTRGF